MERVFAKQETFDFEKEADYHHRPVLSIVDFPLIAICRLIVIRACLGGNTETNLESINQSTSHRDENRYYTEANFPAKQSSM